MIVLGVVLVITGCLLLVWASKSADSDTAVVVSALVTVALIFTGLAMIFGLIQ